MGKRRIYLYLLTFLPECRIIVSTKKIYFLYVRLFCAFLCLISLHFKPKNQCVTINKTLKEAIYAQKNTAKPFFFS